MSSRLSTLRCCGRRILTVVSLSSNQQRNKSSLIVETRASASRRSSRLPGFGCTPGPPIKSCNLSESCVRVREGLAARQHDAWLYSEREMLTSSRSQGSPGTPGEELNFSGLRNSFKNVMKQRAREGQLRANILNKTSKQAPTFLFDR